VPVRVDVRPELLARVRERSGLGAEQLAPGVPKAGGVGQRPLFTLKQLGGFAPCCPYSAGSLLLPKPPEERLSIPTDRGLSGGTSA
jgi:hypothetical protein